MIQFPKSFLWGAATSSHQVEGNCFYNDWWDWEGKGKTKEKSGFACRHYELYREDFDLARQLNHSAHRFSVEWSRIEPQEGHFDLKEIQHYLDVAIALKERNIEPVVTLHHFTLPLWLSSKGGWLDKKASFYFCRYAAKIALAFCPHVRYWVTINEPLVYVYNAYIRGIWPPGRQSPHEVNKVSYNLALAHLEAYRAIHNIYKDNGLMAPFVSIAKHLRQFTAVGMNPYHHIRACLKDYIFNFRLLDYLIRRRSLDFIGVNYYTVEFIPEQNKKSKDIPRNNLGWPIYPEGLLSLLLRLRRYNLGVFIMENGISTDDDRERWHFISAHLKSISEAMQKGVNVMGYLYWSLIDNFEWEKGFGPHFGLIGVDYKTYKRTIKESARKFSLVCETGRLKSNESHQ
jgi:beta-glucosidase